MNTVWYVRIKASGEPRKPVQSIITVGIYIHPVLKPLFDPKKADQLPIIESFSNL